MKDKKSSVYKSPDLKHDESTNNLIQLYRKMKGWCIFCRFEVVFITQIS